MKKAVFLAGILAAVLLTGCGEDKPLDSTSSTSTSSISSTSSSTSSTSSSTSSTSSSTSSSSSTTSSSSTSSSTTSSELVPDWYPGSTSTSTSDPEPTQSTSTSKPEQSNSSTSSTSTQSSSTSTTPAPDPKPIQSSSTSATFSSQPTESPDPVTRYWTPDAPGNKPGPYGGYYDAAGNLHCKKANMPKDDKGYPLLSYEDERGTGHLTYEEDLKAAEEERRISAGGTVTDIGLTWDDILGL